MEIFRSGDRKVELCPYFKYTVEICIFNRGSYSSEIGVAMGSRVFMGEKFFHEYRKEHFGLIQKSYSLIGAPIDWLQTHNYQKI